MSVFAGPATGQSPSLGNLLLSIDFANTKSYSGSGSTIFDSIISKQLTLSNSSFYSFDSLTNSINFDRSSVATSGGYARCVGTGSLTAANYLYNNHSSEILAKINSITTGYQDYPAVYNNTENGCLLAGYVGYHTMFVWNGGGGVNYVTWDGTNAPTYLSRNTTSISLGTSGTQIIQGKWFHIIVTKNGSTYKPYLNGNLLYTDTLVVALPCRSGNSLDLGAAATGTSFNYYSKSNIALFRMYNTVLSDDQVLQNFAAVRGRFGL